MIRWFSSKNKLVDAVDKALDEYAGRKWVSQWDVENIIKSILRHEFKEAIVPRIESALQSQNHEIDNAIREATEKACNVLVDEVKDDVFYAAMRESLKGSLQESVKQLFETRIMRV